jgi:ornithine cyclodeaminase/alanine dehydrogenase
MNGDNTLLYLSRAEVAGLLPPILEQVDLVEDTYRAVASGRVELPPKPGIHPRTDAFIHAMPAYLRDEDVAALKWIAGYPANPQRGLPYMPIRALPGFRALSGMARARRERRRSTR